LISFEAVVEASEPGRFHVRLRNGHRLKASASGGPHLPGREGRVELSPHPCGGWRFIAGR
jgi:translation initiation factor IF-1